MDRKELLALLNGTPAQALIVLGLALTLLAPILSAFRYAEVDSARARYEMSEGLVELDLRKHRQQESAFGISLEKKKEELESAYGTDQLKRALLQAQASAAGMRWHLVIGWLGRLFLLVGLLTLTLLSEGMRQKILLVVLLVVMFSSLSGVNLDFSAQGRMGGTTTVIERGAPSK